MQTLDKVDNEPKRTRLLCRMADINVIIQKPCENARNYSWINPIDTLLQRIIYALKTRNLIQRMVIKSSVVAG